MPGETILVVDDAEDIRILLKRRLTSWGHHVLTAADGWEAYELIREHAINFVITDWTMPVCSGIELCRKIRNTPFDNYVYVILLTGKVEKGDIASGMDAGADDFISKPFDSGELEARINAGLRVLELERRLEEKQRHLERANREIEETYAKISEDLQYAARLQENLLPPATTLPGRLRFEAVFHPCRFLAGDTYNLVPFDENTTICYILDVSGKGVPAALLSFSVGKLLASSGAASIPMLEPDQTADQLNRIFRPPRGNIQYFTMNYAVIDHRAHTIRLTQAGHPPAAFLSRGGSIRPIGEGGYPIGLFPPAKTSYHTLEVDYAPGDRLFLYSDGATETFDPDKNCFGEERLFDLIQHHRDASLATILTRVKESLIQWAGGGELDDDLTICALEML